MAMMEQEKVRADGVKIGDWMRRRATDCWQVVTGVNMEGGLVAISTEEYTGHGTMIMHDHMLNPWQRIEVRRS